MEYIAAADLEAEIDRRIARLLHRVAKTVAADAKSGYPRSLTGEHHTADTIRVVGARIYVGDGTPTWFWVEYGTRPHWIRPNRKQALFWDGALHPVKAVYHPGTPEFAPMRKALYQRRRVLLP